MSSPSLACHERIEVEHDSRVLPVEIWKPHDGPAPAVLVISELFGLNDDIRRIAARFAAHGYLAAAPDLFRGGHWLRCAWRTIAGMQFSRDGGRAAHELEAALQVLERREDVLGVGAVGFCMGGGFALLLGTMGTAKVAGGFYGTTPAFERMQNHMCPVVGGFGLKDRAFAREGKKLERHLKTLDVPHDIAFYDTAGHSFMSPHPKDLSTVVGRVLLAVAYDNDAAEDSWTRMLAFFAEHLGEPTRSISRC